MGKFVPPTPRAAAAASTASPREYATGGSARSNRRNRAFRVLLILSLCYFAGLIALQIFKVRDLNRLIGSARELPAWDPYTIDFWAYILAYPLMTLIALLPVMAALQASYRRNPRGFIIVYAMLQVLLLIIHWVAATNLTGHGPFIYTRGTGMHSFVVYKGALRSIPKYQVLFSLPLLLLPLLLVRRVRQAFAVDSTSQS